ncbi:MAG: MMPL family transporter [Micropruina sp.]|uniref:MMPL family transporter n=1 Tax=Micropruina sp. TaxID=2737536 RepID=UPI0039E52B38
MSSMLYRIGRACYRHGVRVLAVWLLLLAGLGGAVGLLGGAQFNDSFRIPGASSQVALDQLKMTFPSGAATTAQVVLLLPEGESLNAKATKTEVIDALDTFKELAIVDDVVSPYNEHVDGLISDNGRAGLANVQLNVSVTEITADQKQQLEDQAAKVAGLLPGSEVHLGGEVFSTHIPHLSIIEGLGVVVAVIVLLVVLGSVTAAAMPVGTALIGVGIAVEVTMLASQVIEVNSTSLMLAVMISLAVGIDYALFIVSRHRDQLSQGLDAEESTARAVATAGSAVVFAGLTVIIALAGLTISGVPFLGVMGIFSAVGVFFEVLLALTLLPAFLGFAGERLRPKDRRAVRAAKAAAASGAQRVEAADAAPASVRKRFDLRSAWVRTVTAVPLLTVALVVAALGALAFPAKDLQLALPNSGRNPISYADRVTFDVISREFGIGYNGPLVITGTIVESDDPLQIVDDLKADIEKLPGVQLVPLATPNENADTALIQVIPTTGPDDPATAELVQTLRAQHDRWLSEYEIDTSVTGATAVQIDVTQRLAGALLPFGIFVVGLSLVLLTLVFRSIWVPIKAALGFLLSVGAAFGATALVFNQGWFKEVVNLGEPAPVISFLPIILMGVLFGLAMDYEVFLVSRMREEYVHGNTDRFVEDGFIHSSRVVVAAALIMFAVFAFFVPSGEGTIKPIAFALAIGVAIDAFVVRMTLVPAVMKLFGRQAWWLPRWLDRRMPVVDIEGEALAHQLKLQSWPEAGGHVVYGRRLAVRGAFDGVDIAVRPGEVLVVEGEVTARRALLLALAGRLPLTSGDVVVAGRALPEQASEVRRIAAVAAPSHRSPIRDFDGPVLLVEEADLFNGRQRAALAERLRTITEAGGCAVLAHAPGADLSDLLPSAHRTVTLQGEPSHV